MSFNGVMKYLIYGFLGAWLFLLGVMAGRGTVPVHFETKAFQERLKTIVDAYKNPDVQGGPDEKIALNYYDALSEETGIEEMVIPEPAELLSDTPADTRQPETRGTNSEAPEENSLDPAEDIPVKTSRKAATFNKAAADKPVRADAGKTDASPSEKEMGKQGTQGRYTIQVAAFKSFRDAVTQMAALEKKGLPPPGQPRKWTELPGIESGSGSFRQWMRPPGIWSN